MPQSHWHSCKTSDRPAQGLPFLAPGILEFLALHKLKRPTVYCKPSRNCIAHLSGLQAVGYAGARRPRRATAKGKLPELNSPGGSGHSWTFKLGAQTRDGQMHVVLLVSSARMKQIGLRYTALETRVAQVSYSLPSVKERLSEWRPACGRP